MDGKLFTRRNFIDLGRPALLWLAVFVNLIICVTVCVMLLFSLTTFADASAFLIVQVGGVTAPATAYVFQRTAEKRQESQERVELAKPAVPPAPINVENANVTVGTEPKQGAG